MVSDGGNIKNISDSPMIKPVGEKKQLYASGVIPDETYVRVVYSVT